MPQLVRLHEPPGPAVEIRIDGEPYAARAGDTILTALLLHRGYVRHSEFGDGPRAGFCLMGACQDCWVWLAAGTRVRACTTPVADGMAILSRAPD